MLTRPQSYAVAPGIVVRRDAAQPGYWRVFQNSVSRYATAGVSPEGQTALARALAYARTLRDEESAMGILERRKEPGGFGRGP